MTDVSEQTRLALPRKPLAVDLALVQRQPSMTKAIVLCASLAGLQNEKDQARTLGIDQTTWTLIQQGKRALPQDSYETMFDEFGNEAPLIWLADRRGYALVPKESELERRLRIEREANEQLQRENALLRNLITRAA